jgi:hypothetical protein
MVRGVQPMRELLERRRERSRHSESATRDPREVDADHAADTVVSGYRTPFLDRSPTAGTNILSGLGRGRPLDDSTLDRMESRFGESFTDVRIHTGNRAADAADGLHSRAFTVGNDIVFAEGEYAPDNTEGQRLLAHELAHVIQQRHPGGSGSGERETENDAHDAATQVIGGSTPVIRTQAAHGTVQRFGERELPVAFIFLLNNVWQVEVDGANVVAFQAEAADQPSAKAWETSDNICYVVVPGYSPWVTSNGRWTEVRIGRPPLTSPAPKKAPDPIKPKPQPPKPKPKPKPQPQPDQPPDPPGIQVLPEVVVPGNEEPSPAGPQPDRRPVAEQMVTAINDDPAKAAQLAPHVSDPDLEQLTAKDRADLLHDLTEHATGGLDIETVQRILKTTSNSQLSDLLNQLVANDGKLLAALRSSVRPEDSMKLESALMMLQVGMDLRGGHIGIAPNLFDPLGARGFRPPVWLGDKPDWAKDMQERTEANGNITMQTPGQAPIVIESMWSKALRQQRQQDRADAAEANSLSPTDKVVTIAKLAAARRTGSDEEERILHILDHTPPEEAAAVLYSLEKSTVDGKPLLDVMDDAVDGDNNFQMHVHLTNLYLRSRKGDPKLQDEVDQSPVLPWRHSMTGDRAVFSAHTLADGRVAVSYGVIQTQTMKSATAFGPVPKAMRNGEAMLLQPNDLVRIDDKDDKRVILLRAADLAAYENSGNRQAKEGMAEAAALGVAIELAPIAALKGAAIGTAIEGLHQGGQIADGSLKHLDPEGFANSALMGGILGGGLAKAPAAVHFVVGGYMTAQGVQGIAQDLSAGHKWTALADIGGLAGPFAWEHWNRGPRAANPLEDLHTPPPEAPAQKAEVLPKSGGPMPFLQYIEGIGVCEGVIDRATGTGHVTSPQGYKLFFENGKLVGPPKQLPARGGTGFPSESAAPVEVAPHNQLPGAPIGELPVGLGEVPPSGPGQPPTITLYHGTGQRGYEGLRRGIDVTHSVGPLQDLSRGFYTSEDVLVAESGADARNHGELKYVLRYDLPLAEMGNVIDISTGGPHRPAWDRFLQQPPSATPSDPLLRSLFPARTNLEYISSALGIEKRGIVMEEFLHSIGATEVDAIKGDNGGPGTNGAIQTDTLSTQIVIRSQKLADKLNGVARGNDPPPSGSPPSLGPKGGPPSDDYDVAGWKAYYEQNPNAPRSLSAAAVDDPAIASSPLERLADIDGPKPRVGLKLKTDTLRDRHNKLVSALSAIEAESKLPPPKPKMTQEAHQAKLLARIDELIELQEKLDLEILEVEQGEDKWLDFDKEYKARAEEKQRLRVQSNKKRTKALEAEKAGDHSQKKLLYAEAYDLQERSNRAGSEADRILGLRNALDIGPLPGQKHGGAYKDVPTAGGEVHHMPAQSAGNPLNKGPAIWMTEADHQKTGSWGSSDGAVNWQENQRDLIKKGQFADALKMDVEDIRTKFGDKYNKGLVEMLEYTLSTSEIGGHTFSSADRATLQTMLDTLKQK